MSILKEKSSQQQKFFIAGQNHNFFADNGMRLMLQVDGSKWLKNSDFLLAKELHDESR